MFVCGRSLVPMDQRQRRDKSKRVAVMEIVSARFKDQLRAPSSLRREPSMKRAPGLVRTTLRWNLLT
jgi:hypothetical protein